MWILVAKSFLIDVNESIVVDGEATIKDFSLESEFFNYKLILENKPNNL